MRSTSTLFPYLRSNISPDDEAYLNMHARRFHRTLQLARQFLDGSAVDRQPAQIMDVGPHFMTLILRRETGAVVNQLGFSETYGPLTQPRPGERHFIFDLDNTVDQANWPKVPPHDIVVAGEVVEHLHTSPNHWLPFLQSCVSPGGHLIITTPNGVSLRRRLMLLFGVQPYEKIRDNPKNPGHFREYTKAELCDYAQAHHLRVVHFNSSSHLDYPDRLGRIYNLVTSALPSSFRDTMYLVFKNERPNTPETAAR